MLVLFVVVRELTLGSNSVRNGLRLKQAVKMLEDLEEGCESAEGPLPGDNKQHFQKLQFDVCLCIHYSCCSICSLQFFVLQLALQQHTFTT